MASTSESGRGVTGVEFLAVGAMESLKVNFRYLVQDEIANRHLLALQQCLDHLQRQLSFRHELVVDFFGLALRHVLLIVYHQTLHLCEAL